LYIWILIALLSGRFLSAQTLDRIVAIVGDEVILQSDADNQFNYLKINGEKDDGSLKCRVLENLIVSKLLLDKARQDSIEISDIQVEAELDSRMQAVLEQIKEDQFEAIYGKTIPQFRADIKEDIRDELLINQMRQQVLSEASITPKEVKRFYRSLDKDSVGLLPAEVEVNHIVIKPPMSEESIKRAREELRALRRQAIAGEDFGKLAANATQEPGGKQRRGDLGWFGRGQMVPEFEEVVYQMREGDVSEPFRSEFGMHVIKLHERRGEMLQASHILMRLSPSSNGDSIAMDSLRQIATLIKDDSMTFEQAAIRFSQDQRTSHCGGCITNPQTGEIRIPMDALDAELYFKIDEMQEGEMSDPMELRQPDGSRAFHIVYLKKKIPPHDPNLQDDYQKIRDAALQAKKAEKFDLWLQSARKNIYIDIKPTECQNALQSWVQTPR
jgi:peptidyl-prolyl cis-trans isomerase SurA